MAVDSLGYPAADEQDRILKEASNQVKKSAYFMHKHMDADDMKEALKYSASMLGELRTSYLSPQKYYELYMQVFDELANLEAFFADESSKGRSYRELYELVQHAGNVLPRLYLMVAVGCLYIKSGEGQVKEILKDLVEMCKGVQHPTRGLFLRSYLCQRSRGILPDTGSPYEGPGGDINDALDFLLSNFIEMNKLWVRMQHQGSVRDRDKRERERQQLQDLVGKNLTYLSQLDGLDFSLYAKSVLPRVLEQIVGCKDDLAQQYLMQCVIQGFPDAFHLGTLDALLGALPELHSGVKLHSVMASLMDRLAKYASTDPAILAQLHSQAAFDRFTESIAKVIQLHADLPPADSVDMYVALMSFTESVHPGNMDNVNKVLGAAHTTLSPSGGALESRAERKVVDLLSKPLAKYDVVEVLSLDQYPALMGVLQARTTKDIAVKIIQTLLQQDTRITTVDKVEMMFKFVQPLVEETGALDEAGEDEDFAEEQMLVARLLHRLQSDDVATQFNIVRAARTHLEKGGPRRIRHTYPALAFTALRSVRKLTAAAAPSGDGGAVDASAGDAATSAADATADGEAAPSTPPKVTPAKPIANGAGADATASAGSSSDVSSEQMLQWLLETCLALAEVPEPMMALRLLLCCAQSAGEEARLEMLAYEFFEQAFMLYEESVADSREKVIALQAIVGTLHRCYIFGEENRAALVQSVTGYSSKLLKRSDQCRAVCACSHLSWQEGPQASGAAAASATAAASAAAGDGTDAAAISSTRPPVRDADKVMNALKRAIKIANSAKQQTAASARAKDVHYVTLYIDILNQYLYYFEQGVEHMGPSVVQQLLEVVQGQLQQNEDKIDAATRTYWQNTCRHIEHQKARDGDSKQRWATLQV